MTLQGPCHAERVNAVFATTAITELQKLASLYSRNVLSPVRKAERLSAESPTATDDHLLPRSFPWPHISAQASF